MVMKVYSTVFLLSDLYVGCYPVFVSLCDSTAAQTVVLLKDSKVII